MTKCFLVKRYLSKPRKENAKHPLRKIEPFELVVLGLYSYFKLSQRASKVPFCLLFVPTFYTYYYCIGRPTVCQIAHIESDPKRDGLGNPCIKCEQRYGLSKIGQSSTFQYLITLGPYRQHFIKYLPSFNSLIWLKTIYLKCSFIQIWFTDNYFISPCISRNGGNIIDGYFRSGINFVFY